MGRPLNEKTKIAYELYLNVSIKLIQSWKEQPICYTSRLQPIYQDKSGKGALQNGFKEWSLFSTLPFGKLALNHLFVYNRNIILKRIFFLRPEELLA